VKWLLSSEPLLDVADTVTNANLRMYDAGSYDDISLTVNALVVSFGAENAGRYGSRDVRRGLPGLCPLLRLHGRVSRANLCQ